MATKNTKKTTSKKKPAASKQTSKNNPPDIGRKEIARFLAGFFCVIIAIFLLFAFGSYLFTGAEDYSYLDNPGEGDWRNEDYHFHNMCGSIGAKLSFFFINDCFGIASFIMLPFFVLIGVKLMNIWQVRMKTIVKNFILGTILMVLVSIALSSFSQLIPGLDESHLNVGGNHGKNVVRFAVSTIGQPGLFLFLMICAIFYLVYFTTNTILIIRRILRFEYIKKVFANRHKDETPETDDIEDDEDEDVKDRDEDREEEVSSPVVTPPTDDKPEDDDEIARLFDDRVNQNQPTLEFGPDGNIIGDVPETVTLGGHTTTIDLNPTTNSDDEKSRIGEEEEKNAEGDAPDFNISVNKPEEGGDDIERGSIDTPYDPKLDLEFYKYPSLDLLSKSNDNSPQIDMAEQNANKDQIIHVLKSFGVEISSIKATIGPTITLYEITPAEGMRISKIRNLEDDIALSLAAEGIRIIAPIPGKGTIGIEVPNKKKCIVSMESVLNSRVYQESTMELPCAIGKTISNDVFMFDLAKAPHLLVAGATGQGKSVGLNAIVTSLLYKKHPSELKIVMVDPKKVEFSIYSPIENHFLARLEEEEECIITDVQKVVKTLNSLCALMDSRYDLLKKAGVRNIKEYNAKFKERKLNPENGHEFMPYIVVIVDEFGDLIMTAGKEVELPICRIAQLARAVGIHMIIATQRPQASIISGAIKTNFPTRIAFKVSSMMDSRVILDRPGANQLIGRGDLLYLSGAEPIRVQCAFVDTPEVSDICQHIACQQSYLHPLYLPEVVAEGDASGGTSSVDVKKLDPMFAEVSRFVVSNQNGSTSQIQRNYSIGYNRAGKIMDQLERMGVVGSQQGAKPREVLIKDMNTLDSILNNIG